MAKTTVEILGGQLDGTILNNMASEATMRELLAAVKQNSGGSVSGGSGARTGGQSPAAKLRKNSSVMSKLADGLGNQIGNAIGAVGSMGAMLLTGNTKLSAYTRTLNDQVISKLPIFGGLLGGVGGLLNDSIEVLEEWNDSLKLGTSTGATFGNSILRASKAATASAMNIDDFMRMMSAHSPVMLNLGKTVTEGAEKFSRLSKKLNREGGLATNTLRQMGFSAQDVNEAFIRYIDITGMGMRGDKKSDDDLLKSFDTFQVHLIKMGYLTGKSVKQLEGQMAVANQDIVFKMQMAKLGSDQRDKVNTALSSYVSMYGESGAELFKALFLGMPPGNEDAQNLFVLMPHLVGSMRDSINSAKHGTANIEQYTAETEDKLIKTMLQSAKSANGLEGMLDAAGASHGDAQKFRQSIQPILEQLIKHGDITKLTEPQLRAMFAQAKKETTERETLTKFLNDFEMAMQNLKFRLMEEFLPLLNDLATTLEKQDVAGKVRQFGVLLKDSVEKYLPDVITFFKYLGSDDGRDFIWNEVVFFFDKMGLRFNRHMKEVFGKDTIGNLEKELEDGLQKAQEDHENRQGALRAGGRLPAAYKPGNEQPSPPGEKGKDTGGKGIDLKNKNEGMVKNSEKLLQTMASQNVNKFFNPLGKEALKRTSDFARDRVGGKIHPGVDYRAAIGTPLYAPHGGFVSYGNMGGGAGYTVTIEDSANKLKTIAMHLDPKSTADKFYGNQNKAVKAGDPIGFTGVSGTKDPHLHMQTRYNGELIDFDKYLVGDVPRSHRTGTLGQYGSLFKDFGAGTNVILDDVEAVMTPDQMNSVVTGAGNIATTEMLESLDRNFQRLANIMAERTSLSRSQLSYIEKNQVNIA
jgi:murein DD-endopeptidase MepM/ murein hydrolase activator NlpD